jgi:hypothetical protein
VGHQVNFYITPRDEAAIELKLKSLAPAVVLHHRSPGPEPRVIDSIDVRQGDERWLYLYLARSQDLSQVVTQHVPAQGYWGVDVMRSPVIEFTRCYFDDKILRRGRVYYVDGFFSPGDAWVEKSEGFKDWAKSVLSTVKKSLKRTGSDYVGADALNWLESSGGKLVA